ncbi:MAG: TonB-system energizer ExbB [Candidatus Endonucleobacter sp. (ex Gigantidas childressi)]|nr:TonB-system energizer ExbB [Candidatus Endonucleobacter sp. (ex Gigantidas childressi)]
MLESSFLNINTSTFKRKNMPIEQIKYIVDYGIIGLLALLSFLTVILTIERIFFYRSIKIEEYTHGKELEISLTKNLPSIASIGANAPYIGLLGTVLAIMLTFYIIGDQQDTIDPGEIMKHLALALKATAAGLVVAIPATAFYNALLTKVDIFISQWQILQDTKGSTNNEA